MAASAQERTEFFDVSVLRKGRPVTYTVPSFPVFTAMLQPVLLQWEDSEGDVFVFDGFMRECELMDHPLPALARVPTGQSHAFLVEVCG